MAKLLHIFYHKEGTFSLLCQQARVSGKSKYLEWVFIYKVADGAVDEFGIR